MPAKIIVEEVQKDVTLMTEPQAEFVSLVRHGANRMPFRVVKTAEKGGETSVTFAVQSILLPNGKQLNSLAAQEGKQWLADVRVDKAQKYEGYQKLVQTEMVKFDPASLQMVALGDGALAIVGKLSQETPNAIVLDVEAAKSLAMAPLDAPMESEAITLAPTFRDLMDREISSMLDIVYGALKQAAADPKQRKSTIIGAIDNFKTFFTTGLDSIGTAKVEFTEKTETTGGLDEMFKTKEEFVAAVGEVVAPMLQEFGTKLGETLKTELAPKAPEKTETTDPPQTEKVETPDFGKMVTEAVDKAMKPFTEKLDALAAKTEKIGSQVTTDPAATTTTDPPVEKTEVVEKKSVFSGLLTGKALSRRELDRGASA